MTLEDFLFLWGMRPTLVDGGRAALHSLERAQVDGHPYALVLLNFQMPDMDGFQVAEHIMDVQMPEMDGLEALEATAEIRRGEAQSGRHVPIVALTAHARGEDRERCLAAGMDEFLTKPFGAAELFAMIEKLSPGALLGPDRVVAEGPPRATSGFDKAVAACT